MIVGPSGFSDSGRGGTGRRDHHIGLTDADRARLAAIEAELRPYERVRSGMVRVNRLGDEYVLSDADGYKLAGFTYDEFVAFVEGAKAGEFDDMITPTDAGE